MNKTTTLSTLALLAALTWAPAAHADCAVQGQVYGPEGDALPGASVTWLEAGASAKTDRDGRFCLPGTPTGTAQLLVYAEGFAVGEAKATADADGVAAATIQLRPSFDDRLVVTATRTEKRRSEVAVQLRVMDRAQIEGAAARTLADAVEWMPGVRVENNCQNCNESKVRLLGMEGPYSQLLIDGQPTVSSLALVYGIEQMPARLIESIEVVKGGGSSLYGAGAVAGVINLISHQPSHDHAVFDARYNGIDGTDGVSLSGVVDRARPDQGRAFTLYGQTDRVPAVDVDGDGFSEVSRRQLEAFGVRFESYLLEDQGRLDGELSWTSEERRGGDRLHLPPHEANIAEAIDTQRAGLGLRWLHTRSSRFDYRLAASYSDTRRDSYYGTGMDSRAYGETDNPHWVFDSQLNHYRDHSTLTWGVQYNRDEIEDVQLGYGRVLSERHQDLGLFVQDDRRLQERWTLLYGLRVDDHSAVADPIVSPRVALLWSPKPALTVRASASTGFRPPVTFDEDLHITLVGGGEARVVRNSPELSEERSRNMMLGVEWRPTLGRKGNAFAEVALFDTRLTDLFHEVEEDRPETPEAEFTRINLGGARVHGVELAFSMRWGTKISADLGWVEQRARFDRPEPDFGSRAFLRTPERYGTASLTWRAPGQLDLFLGARYTGPMKAPHYAGFIAEDRLERTPPTTTVDVNLARAFALDADGHRQLTVTAGVKNLTDEFQEDLDRGPLRDSSYVYGPRFPRTFHAAVKVDF